MSTKRYDQQPEIYNECNAQEFSQEDIFKCIISESHFSLYPDIFNDDNFSSLSINDISENKEADLNESPLSFQDREVTIEHPFAINKYERFVLPCLNILYEKEQSRESCEVIYDNYFDIEDVDLSRENHQKLQITSGNERYSNSNIISTDPHSKAANHLYDSIIQESTPVYDSYHDQAFTPVHNHNSLSNSQDGVRNYSSSIILANPCEKENISKRSQLSYKTTCTYNHCILFRLPSFCIKPNFALYFNFQILDILLWHTKHLTYKRSRDALSLWKIEVFQKNVELFQYQYQSISMFFEKLLSYPRKCQKNNVFFENFKQYKLIDKFPLGRSHPFFIDPFRKIYLETFLSLKIIKGLTFTHNINNTLQVDSKNSYSQSALSSFLLNVNQSIIETHPHFYDPIGIQLERKFH